VSPAARSLIAPGLATLVALAILLSLGTWQMQRLDWKLALIAQVEARARALPQPLPPVTDWPRLNPAADEFRAMSAALRFVPGAEVGVYGNETDPATGLARPGTWRFALAETADGGRLLVNRGFVPDARRAMAAPAPSGIAELDGVLRFPQGRTWVDGADDPARDLFYVRDPAEIARAKGWGPVAPFYLVQVAPPSPGGLPAVGLPRIDLRNNHLGYAITWYGLAATLVGVFAAFAAGRLRRGA
jgi:surfeit locus 1 family protein